MPPVSSRDTTYIAATGTLSGSGLDQYLKNHFFYKHGLVMLEPSKVYLHCLHFSSVSLSFSTRETSVCESEQPRSQKASRAILEACYIIINFYTCTRSLAIHIAPWFYFIKIIIMQV